MAAAAKGQLESDQARGRTSPPVEAALPGHDTPQSPRRLRWRVTGQVQGVGLRPYVYRLATLLRLRGFVHNDERGVVIEAQGPSDALDALEQRLRDQPPPLCRVDHITRQAVDPQSDEKSFAIRTSPSTSGGGGVTGVTPDAAVCDDCLRELFDPQNRRHRYPLINCTHCGPRYTIVQRVPYDRPNTTLSRFAMCEPCAAEYADPRNRRFHAQPTACPDCGPRLQLVDSQGRPLGGEPIPQVAAMLRDRAIIAVKGIGGFHLCCRADDAGVVTRLRQLKNRDAKPFALMVRDLPTAERLVHLSNIAIDAMRSPACPIILAPRSQQLSGAGVVAEVAPGMHRLGVMLPYTPVHHLLFACEQTPAVLVMTSANLCDEPLVRDNDEALSRLSNLCDAMLWHDRPIHRGVDDSVFIDFGDNEPLLPVRRARGYAPQPVVLPSPSFPQSLNPSIPQSLSPGLCLGGELKNTIAVVRDGQAILSHHLGDLKHPAALANFKQAVTDLCDLARVTPQWIAHDLHPAYLSTLHAQHLSRQWGVPLFAVQHHHAHAAAVLAEHQHPGPALAVVCDGVGYGTDGQIWGGELLLAGYSDFVRLAHLRPLKLPGGDAAAIDTRRCAMAMLQQVVGDPFAATGEAAALYADFEQRHAIGAMLEHNVRTVATTAAGRYFDAVAALLGLAAVNRFEAQAAMALEAAAAHAAPLQSANDTPLFRLTPDAAMTQIDLVPLIARILELNQMGHDRSALAAMFHEQLALAFAAAVTQASQHTGIRVVALSGGCFCNQLLTARLTHHLQSRGFTVLRHTLVPPGDGSVALGQAAIASALFGGTH
ncbi:MAG: carbamoyltransferase HypF [Phycisphaeraceae bacterium]